jgi:hypothetical protein
MMKSLLAKRKPLGGMRSKGNSSAALSRLAFQSTCGELQMNIKMTSIALALIATSAAAFAAEEYVEYTNVPSTRTRAEVRAELEQSRNPIHAATQQEFVEHQPVATGKTRAEVRAELDSAYAQGELGRTPEYVEHTHIASTKSREEVRNEAIQAARGGRGDTSRFGS